MKYIQQATLWEMDGYNEFGLAKFKQPEQRFCRWEQRQELYVDESGEEIHSQAVVYLDKTTLINSYIYLGVTTNNDPPSIPNAFKINVISEIPSLNNRKKIIKLLL